MAARGQVVVGTDGSETATRAVVAAAREAVLRGTTLRVVHAFVWPAMYAPMTAGANDPALREAAEALLAEAREAAQAAEPGVTCETQLVTELPAAALLRASHDAALLVVADRGVGGFASLLVGSTAVQISMYAPCPVMVVRGRAPGTGDRIVVGVDASEHSRDTLEFAVAEAALRKVPVHVIHAWTGPAAGEAEATRVTAELCGQWRAKHPDVALTHEVVRAPAARTLIEASADAGLVVVGARGVGGFRGLLFGSVSQAVLHHAHCPVGIVPVRR